jgi:hypothetical protein
MAILDIGIVPPDDAGAPAAALTQALADAAGRTLSAAPAGRQTGGTLVQ